MFKSQQSTVDSRQFPWSGTLRGVRTSFTAFAFVVAAAPAFGQKPTLKPEDYAKWENLGTGVLSPDGKWLAYSITRVDGDEEVRLRDLASDSTRVLALGRAPAFSDDSRWLAFTIGVTEKERKALEKASKPVRSRLGLVDLRTGAISEVADIPSFAFSGDGKYISMRGYIPEGRKTQGADVIVRDLATGRQTSFGNVADSQWQDEGRLLALVLDAEGKLGNGIQLFDPATGIIRTLESDTATYTELTWREKSDDLAVMKVRGDSSYEGETHIVLAWSGLATPRPVKRSFDPASQNGFPKDTRVVAFRNLDWSEDGATVFFGIGAWEPKPKDAKDAKDASDSTKAAGAAKPTDDEEKAGVDIWHARDVDIIPEQKVRADLNRRRNFTVAWHLAENRFVEVSNDLSENANITKGARYAVASDQSPYERERMFGPQYSDLYLVDIANGQRTKIKERIQFSMGLSSGGKYVLYLEKDHYWLYDIAKKTHTNITKDINTSFVNRNDDHTVTQKPPFGVGGWTPGDRSVLLNDEFDIWEVAPDGSKAARLSDGAADRVRHRIVRIDIDEDIVDPAKPVYVALYGDRIKKFGYGTIQRGKPAQRTVFLDKNVSRLTKAEDAEVYSFLVQGFDDSPDYFVAGATLADAKPATSTNPFQNNYAWGKAQLIDFKNTQGKDLQGALFYPANYEPGRKYPMIVYIYEITSNTLHSYTVPSERNAYNPTVWTQNGYFVFRPDIVYRDRNPGMSAVEALVPAVKAAVATGMIDEKKVGITGHSWGGYQSAFVPTQTDIFAASVAGAPLTELYTMYLSIYWNTGGTDARIFEISQGRMEVPPWEDLPSYLANSPVHHIQKLKTPMLVTFGDKDGAVDWHQGIVMYNAARRENKDLVMLVYEGENHGLAKKANQIDYHRRVMDWFNHYLKGDPAPQWITDGVKFLEKDKEKKAIVTTRPISSSR
jgi:dipeptidyl aminopeptidase/acylaminoacyl peptidase